jgi:hypothetical protein
LVQQNLSNNKKNNMKKIISLVFICQMITTIAMAQANVGIGTNTPQYPLDLVGRMRLKAGTVNDPFTSSGIWYTDYRNNNNIIFAGMADSVNLGYWSERSGLGWQYFFDARYGNVGIGRKPGAGGSRLAIDYASGASLALYADGVYRGAVGANDSTVYFNGSRSFNLLSSGGDVIIQQPGGCVGSPFQICSYPGRTGFYVNKPNARVHVAVSTGTTGMLLGSSTATPAVGYMLSVEGKIICEELRVQLNAAWPDYVFEPEYKRISLTDLEATVKLQKHLPGIPSAAEMEKENGILVGDFQQKLLEKMEELYLYVFELNNENKALRKQMEALTKKVE